MSFFFSSAFDAILEKATGENHALPGDDSNLAEFLQVADYIKSGQVKPQTAVSKICSRLKHYNPNVQILTLDLLDVCIKNCGHEFVKEATASPIMGWLEELLRQTGVVQQIKIKVLEYIQNWALALKDKPDFVNIQSIYSSLKADGFNFPPVKANITIAALMETKMPPKWAESDSCYRCRTKFTTTNRRHHCRECGKSFCEKCSSKKASLLHFGFSEPQRVCESCFEKLQNGVVTDKRPVPDDLALSEDDKMLQEAIKQSLIDENQPVSQVKKPVNDNTDEAQFADDMKRAIEASLQSDFRSEAAPIASASVPVQASPKLQPYQLSDPEINQIRLFAQLVDKSSGMGHTGALQLYYDQELSRLCSQLLLLKDQKIASLLSSINSKLSYYLRSYEQLNECTQLYDQLLERRLAQSHKSVSMQDFGSSSSVIQPVTSEQAPPSTQLMPTFVNTEANRPDEPLIQL